MKITVQNNKNTSPAENEENEHLSKGLMVEGYENVEELEIIKEILTILEEEEIVSSWSYDREDTDKESIHSHFYLESEVNNNSLTSLINRYISNKDISTIKKIKEKIIMDKELYNTGVLDTDPKAFKLNKEQERIIKENIDNFLLIGQDSDGVIKYDDFISHNRGYGEFDKPSYLLDSEENIKSLRGQYDFTFYFDKEIDSLNMEVEAKEALKEVLSKRYKNANTSFLNIDIKAENNTLNINFNNVLKSQNDNSFFMVSKTQIKKINELFLKRLAERTDLIIQTKTSFIKYYKTVEEVEAKKENRKIKEAKHDKPVSKKTETQKGEQEQEQEVETQFLDFTTQLKETKDLEVFETSITLLIEEANKIKAVKGLIPDIIISEKLAEIKDKLAIIEVVKKEKAHELKQQQEIKELGTSLKEEQEAHTKTEEELNKTAEQLKETTQDLKAEEKSHEETHKVVKKYADAQIKLKAEAEEKKKLIKEQEQDINELTVQSELDKKAYSSLKQKEETTSQSLSEKVKELSSTKNLLETATKKILGLENTNSNLNKDNKILTNDKTNLDKSLKEKKKELEASKNEAKEIKQELDQGKQEAKAYLEELTATHEQEKAEASNYVNELLARISELEEDGKRGQGEKKKISKTPTPKPNK